MQSTECNNIHKQALTSIDELGPTTTTATEMNTNMRKKKY